MADSENIKPKRTTAQNLAFVTKKAEEAKARTATTVSPAKTQQLSLELWAEAARGVPNVLLRNALFGVSKERVMHQQRTLIASTKDVEIRFKGETFNQTDLDVFETLLHLARLQPLGQSFECSASALLTALGRKAGKSQYEQLKEDIMRLVTGGVEITFLAEKKSFMGTLVRHTARDDETKNYIITLESDLMKLFGQGFTLTDWAQRKALGQSNLAKWLQSHYATHAKPYPEKVVSLHKLCGSNDKSLRSFRSKLKIAFDELVRVGSLKSWRILPSDLVDVEIMPSPSQQKRLAKLKLIHKNG